MLQFFVLRLIEIKWTAIILKMQEISPLLYLLEVILTGASANIFFYYIYTIVNLFSENGFLRTISMR